MEYAGQLLIRKTAGLLSVNCCRKLTVALDMIYYNLRQKLFSHARPIRRNEVSPMPGQERKYAVAVRDDELYLFFRITRSPSGVYVMIPMKSPEERKEWNPHASYHASGEHFQKSYDQKFSPRQRQKPDSTFQGVEYIMARPIAAREPRAFNVRCKAEEFYEVFEISVHELRSETYRTAIEIDLAEPQDSPIMPCNATSRTRIIRQQIFQDAIPWIAATLYDMGPGEEWT
jgi:hypothetical protein